MDFSKQVGYDESAVFGGLLSCFLSGFVVAARCVFQSSITSTSPSPFLAMRLYKVGTENGKEASIKVDVLAVIFTIFGCIGVL